MATSPLPFDLSRSRVINPLNNPYFGTYAPNGNPNRMGYTQGGGNGLGIYDWEALSALGYDTSMFAQQPLNGDGAEIGLNPQATADWLAANGLQLNEAPDATGNIYRYITDQSGNLVGAPQFFNTDDDAFLAATLAAAGITGANIWAAGAGAGGGTAAIAEAASAPTATTGATAYPVSPGNFGVTSSLGTVPETVAGSGTINFGSGAASSLYSPTGYASGGLSAAGGSAVPAATPASTGWASMLPNTLGGWGQLASSIYGIYQGNKMMDMAEASDPFRAYRPEFAAQLSQLMQNPSMVTSLPGYKASMDSAEQALTRNLASQGLTGSGAAAEALAKFGGEFQNQAFNQYISQLAGLAGAGAMGSQGLMAGTAAGYNTINQSLNNLFKIQPRG